MIDGGGVESIDRGIQIHRRGFLRVLRSGDTNQVLHELAIHLSGLHCIRVGPRVARKRLAAKNHVIQSCRFRSQVDFDCTQGLVRCQLGEVHDEELIETGESLHLVLAAMGCHAMAKRGERQMAHDLRKREHALMHGGIRRKSENGSNSAPRRSNRDQTQSLVSADQSTYNRLS